MKKLLAAVAVSAFALTSAVPMALAAPSTAGVHQAKHQNVHKAATTKKKATKTKSTKSTKKKSPTKSS